jgi:hypothetical protein
VLLEDGEVRDKDLDSWCTSRAKVRCDGFEASIVTADEDDFRPVCCEGLRRLAGNRGGGTEYSQFQALLPFDEAATG